jgi:succinate dehydrogenase / fumarate reductase flavoprotein subunit
MHGANRLGGNSLSDLLVFGRRAGTSAAEAAASLEGERPTIGDDDIRAAADAALAPFERQGGENAYAVQQDLQDVMHRLVGIIRKADEMEQALEELDKLNERCSRLSVEGHRQYNPGWHLALDLHNMLRVSQCIALAALERTESRGGHTRDDFPATEDSWATVNLHCVLDDGGSVAVRHEELPSMPDELRSLFEEK